VLKRRITRLLLVAALAAGSAAGVAACGGSKAGDGQTSPPSTSK
jgi:hypothetical protein